MSKYTPGPWRVIPEHEMVIGAGDATIVYELNTNEDDARLIAAAPELLEALKECVSAMDKHMEGDGYTAIRVGLARAAIHKATGEQA